MIVHGNWCLYGFWLSLLRKVMELWQMTPTCLVQPPACWHLCLNSNSELHLSPWLCRRKRQCFSSYFEMYSSQSQGNCIISTKIMTVSEEIYWNGFGCHQLQKKREKPGKCCNHGYEQRGGLCHSSPSSSADTNAPQAPSQGSLKLLCVIPQCSREPDLPLLVKSKAQLI